MIQHLSRCPGSSSSLLCSSLLLAGEVVSCYMYIGNSMFWHTGTHTCTCTRTVHVYTDYYYMYVQ